jgi:hypothetical protein
VLRISPASGFDVRITATNTSDPVRNIRVVASAFEGNYSSQVFQPAFLAQVAGAALVAGVTVDCWLAQVYACALC